MITVNCWFNFIQIC